jgi:anti-anti-sigma regulatory factor
MAVAERLKVETKGERLVLVARGTLDGELADAIREPLVEAFTASLDVLIDLREITDYDDAGAKGLLRSHEWVAAKSRRSVYIVTRPRVRALVFKVIHATGDEQTRPVSTPDTAEAWLRDPNAPTFTEISLGRARSLLARFRAKLASRKDAPL